MTRKPRKIELIVVHCSSSRYGNAALIDEWHRARGWRGIGYHFVILNGYPDVESYNLKRPKFWLDGVVEAGRLPDKIGAHVRGRNRNSIGICLIGMRQFTHQQYESLVRLFGEIRNDFPRVRLFGHYELLHKSDPPKTCPNIDMDWLRGMMEKRSGDE